MAPWCSLHAKAFAPKQSLCGDQACRKSKTGQLREREHPLQRASERSGSVMCLGCWSRLTIKNRTLEETQELEEQVFLLRHDLVEAELFTALLNLVIGDTLLDVGLEPVVRDHAIVVNARLLRGLPELKCGASVWQADG